MLTTQTMSRRPDLRAPGLESPPSPGLLGRVPLGVLQLGFRLAIASVFLKAGLNKLASWRSPCSSSATSIGWPALPPEIAADQGHHLRDRLLDPAHRGSRHTGWPRCRCSDMICVIQLFVYPDAYSEHLTWASILAFLLTRGGGPISLDRLLGLEPTQN
jgi:putative oxidoreductase